MNAYVPDRPADKGPNQSLRGALEHGWDSNKSKSVDQGHVDKHGPIDVALLVMVSD